jgi:hypothetical protein
MTCEACHALAEFEVFAGYDLQTLGAHPTLARYPAPIIRTCRAHLGELLEVDHELPASTRCWVVVPVGA